jgi:hypothetical protein
MTDYPMDIVSRLRRLVHEERGYKNLQMHCLEAADEIERLRVAGEDLAEALRDTRRRHQCDCADGYDERTGDLALAQWEEARRD